MTTDDARVTDDDDERWSGEVVEGARRGNFLHWMNRGVTRLAERLAARDSERAEMAALLSRADDMLRYYNGSREHFDRRGWLAEYERIAAKLRGTP